MGIRANRTKRLREKLLEHIKRNGPKSSRELLDYYNSTSRQGSTMNSMANVLAKDPRFRVVRKIMVGGGHIGSRYEMLVWGAVDTSEEE